MLSLLLLPCMVISNSDKNYQIEQLKKAQCEKEEEIVFIIKQIDEKELLIDAFYLKAINVLENINCDDIDLLEEANILEFNLQQALIQHKSMKIILESDFVNDSNKNKFELKRMKYLVIRYALEYMNLYKLIHEYEKCLQELFEINNKSEELQK